MLKVRTINKRFSCEAQQLLPDLKIVMICNVLTCNSILDFIFIKAAKLIQRH